MVTILLVNHRFDCFAPFIADVADRDESCLVEVEQFAEVVCTAGTDANAAENDLVGGRNGARSLAEHHAADDHGRDGAFENLATCSHGSINKDSIPNTHTRATGSAPGYFKEVGQRPAAPAKDAKVSSPRT